ncbi:MAG: type II/IV secretion system protein [Patescibacteria group bacterium]
MTHEQLHELLVTPGHVREEDFQAALAEAGSSKKAPLEVLVDKGLVKDEQVGQLIAGSLGMPFVNLREEKIEEVLLNVVPELVARSKEIIVFGRAQGGPKIATAHPEDIETIHFIEKRLGEKALVYYATSLDLHNALSRYKTGLKDAFQGTLTKLEGETLSREEQDEGIVALVDTLLRYGYESKVSDIHVEPHKEQGVIRFRIDGIMHDVLTIPARLLESIITRIKVLAKMRTDEHRAAQDGKLTFQAEDDETVDVRVSSVPITNGENIVMRILSAKSRQYNIADIGLSEEDLVKVERSIDDPHGMILVTGPTGSGKTTTVYAMLKILNTRDVHIATIEDPVEYDIEGISQIQVNQRTDLTFAKGLRAIVRQDPDIIMVGEIRDEETAGIAVNSAMTGHLVLSTLHANDAATTLPRLLDMGIEPFLVSSTVNIIIAQRLVRKICDKCRVSYPASEAEDHMIRSTPHIAEAFGATRLKALPKTRFYKGSGCNVCSQTGYLGRVGIFEVLMMDDEIKALVTKRATSPEIIKLARERGMATMMEDGIRKAIAGITTLDEVVRATME